MYHNLNPRNLWRGLPKPEDGPQVLMWSANDQLCWREQRFKDRRKVHAACIRAMLKMRRARIEVERMRTGRIITQCPFNYSPRVGSISCRYRRCMYGIRVMGEWKGQRGVFYCRRKMER